MFNVQVITPLSTAPIAHNVLAAWRQAGVSVRLGREVNFQNLARCPTRQHPRLRQTACWATARTGQRKLEKVTLDIVQNY